MKRPCCFTALQGNTAVLLEQYKEIPFQRKASLVIILGCRCAHLRLGATGQLQQTWVGW